MDKNIISIDKEKPKFYGLFMFLYQNVNLIVNTALIVLKALCFSGF